MVSLIIPCYNAEKYIGRCLDSVLNQTDRNIELIVVNDGSTDNSDEIIREQMKIDSRIQLIDKQNRIDPLLFCLLVKVDDAVHHAVIRDGCRGHAQFLYPGDILFDFVGTVQKTVFRMCVQMDKRHVLRLFPLRCTCCVR